MRGQALIETLCSMTLVMLVGVGGFVLVIHCLGSLILAKWAAKTSHCVSQNQALSKCQRDTTQSLAHYFAFKKIDVRVRTHQGIIHSEIDGKLLGNTLLRSSYDLSPSEYKRDK